VAEGVIPTVGRDARDGSLVMGSERSPVIPKSVWKRRLHDATNWGKPVLRAFVGPTSFTYPKSPYAVRDTISTIVADTPDAVILDFFAGSGTTLHATCMLNAADGGRRRSILVTNNEVGVAEAGRLASEGHHRGDIAWEGRGIYELVTRPRCEAVVTGARADGSPVEGTYDDGTPYSDGFEENVQFLELTYLDPDEVELDLAFARIAPLLWLRAGATGPILEDRRDGKGDERPFAWTERYGVLFDPDRWRAFVENLPDEATTAFVVTDSQATFAGVVAELPDHLDVVRLYESYLTTFRFDSSSI